MNNRKLTSDKLTGRLKNLPAVMRDGGLYSHDDIPWFNGGLFKTIKMPPLIVLEMTELRNAASLNWRASDASIFGMLFKRGLNPACDSENSLFMGLQVLKTSSTKATARRLCLG